MRFSCEVFASVLHNASCIGKIDPSTRAKDILKIAELIKAADNQNPCTQTVLGKAYAELRSLHHPDGILPDSGGASGSGG